MGVKDIDVQWLQASVNFPLLLGQSRVLDGVGFLGRYGGGRRLCMQHAGGLVVDPVSDNSIRFHENTRLLTLHRKVPSIFRHGFGLRKSGC